MRRLAALLPLVFVACTYPEFAFNAHDSVVSEQDAAVDTFVEPLDTRTPDTATTPDTSVADARDAADTAMPRGCALPHTFCQNFDSVTMPGSGWTSNFSDAGGTLALDKAYSVSSPNSLRVSVPSATVTSSAMLVQTIGITSSTTVIRVDAEMMLPSLTWGGAEPVFMFKVQRSSAGDGVALIASGSGLAIAAQTDADWNTWPVSGVTAGKWFHVRMEVALHPTAGTVRVFIDDMTTPKVTQTGVRCANADDLARQLLVGLFAYMSSSPFTVYFDDVSFDVP